MKKARWAMAVAFILTGLFSSASEAGVGVWDTKGPGEGGVNALTVVERNGISYLYAGLYTGEWGKKTGVYRLDTSDSTGLWSPVAGNNGLTNTEVESLTSAKVNGTYYVYAGTLGGLFQINADDPRARWSLVANNSGLPIAMRVPRRVYHLHSLAVLGTTLYAAVEAEHEGGGIYKIDLKHPNQWASLAANDNDLESNTGLYGIAEALVSYKGILYVGVNGGPENIEPQYVLKIDPAHPTKYERVAGNNGLEGFPYPHTGVLALTISDGVLYAGISPALGHKTEVYQLNLEDPTSWVRVGDDLGDKQIESLLFMNGALYLGSGWSNDVYATVPGRGAAWSSVGGNLEESHMYINALASVNGVLYAGTRCGNFRCKSYVYEIQLYGDSPPRVPR